MSSASSTAPTPSEVVEQLTGDILKLFQSSRIRSRHADPKTLTEDSGKVGQALGRYYSSLTDVRASSCQNRASILYRICKGKEKDDAVYIIQQMLFLYAAIDEKDIKRRASSPLKKHRSFSLTPRSSDSAKEKKMCEEIRDIYTRFGKKNLRSIYAEMGLRNESHWFTIRAENDANGSLVGNNPALVAKTLAPRYGSVQEFEKATYWDRASIVYEICKDSETQELVNSTLQSLITFYSLVDDMIASSSQPLLKPRGLSARTMSTLSLPPSKSSSSDSIKCSKVEPPIDHTGKSTSSNSKSDKAAQSEVPWNCIYSELVVSVFTLFIPGIRVFMSSRRTALIVEHLRTKGDYGLAAEENRHLKDNVAYHASVLILWVWFLVLATIVGFVSWTLL